MKNIAIFASGTGSNFLAIYDAIRKQELQANISLLVSDKPKSKAVENAKLLGIDYFASSPRKYESKSHYEKDILSALKEREVDLIVLAGYMRLIGSTILSQYPRRIINIHPSLLPSFKGIDAIGQAIESKVKVTGVTVHYVDEGMDTGEVIAQESLLIENMKTREEIETSIHSIEHKLYPQTIKKVLEDLK